MTERAREAGGQLDITSAPGQGTQLRLRVPLL
jgi:signal transduction histidine kinase